MTTSSPTGYPDLTFTGWRETRDALRLAARSLGAVRRAVAPPQKHWWHVGLHAGPRGLRTGSIPAPTGAFELTLDLVAHRLEGRSSHGPEITVPLRGLSPAALHEALVGFMAELDIEPGVVDPAPFTSPEPWTYEGRHAHRLWNALSRLETVFRRFKGEFRRESSPVLLYPHHFDLALSWFSGRLVPGQDPSDPDQADEQLTFGFSTGDTSIPEPYVYVTAYPLPDGLSEVRLDGPAEWHRKGFEGAVLPYAALVATRAPDNTLIEFLRTVHHTGRDLMPT